MSDVRGRVDIASLAPLSSGLTLASGLHCPRLLVLLRPRSSVPDHAAAARQLPGLVWRTFSVTRCLRLYKRHRPPHEGGGARRAV